MLCKYCEIEMNPIGFSEENCNGWLCPNPMCGHKEYDVASMKIAGDYWAQKTAKVKKMKTTTNNPKLV